jgi:hypothetical protein
MKTELEKLWRCLIPRNYSDKYRYLGYVYIPYKENDERFKIIKDLIIYIDKKAKPKFIPRFILRLLHLYGNDNSIVRLRNYKLHKLHFKLTKGLFITDIKTKWTENDIRIYGNFDNDINYRIMKIEDLFEAKFNRNIFKL